MEKKNHNSGSKMQRIKNLASYGFWALDTWDDIFTNTNSVKNVDPKASAVFEVNFIRILFGIILMMFFYICKEMLLMICNRNATTRSPQ